MHYRGILPELSTEKTGIDRYFVRGILKSTMMYVSDELIPLFKRLGITEYEAKVYLSLLTSHPASAYTISQGSGVPHSRVYDVTRRLIQREMVISTGTKPELFSPLSPDRVIEKLEREYSHYTDELEKGLERYNFRADFDPVWNLNSREHSLQKTKYILDQAQHTVFIGLWDPEFSELRDSLRAAHERGVKVFSLVYGREDPGFGVVYHHGTDHMPDYERLGRTLDCTVDSSWCITGTMGKEFPCRLVWSQNLGLVQTIESHIKHDFYLAEMNRTLGGEIERRYGKNLALLRSQFGETDLDPTHEIPKNLS